MKKDLSFLIAQFFLFAFYFIDIPLGLAFELPDWIEIVFLLALILGFVVIIFGIINMNDSLSPFPKPKNNGSLISNGIYHYVRHPIYIGIVIAMISFGCYIQSVFKISISLVLLGVFYLKSELEEKYLLHKFEEYTRYKEDTGRFFPKISSKK
ncbi:MAG: protein-S-isoprenylcysteine methyltransferase [Flavobacteriaceae bacterium]|nr:protein-S-isoprenylcysteine methyltransferase [Flavobacteriaceae bacterium]|tara:strand:- start:930 stop:1388 length:459 start_codon:yes stop_codon:yes gene_type:complete